MIGSLILQLLIHSGRIHESVERLFSRHANGTKPPGKDSLIETFQGMLKDFEHVFIIVDALDECSNREGLLEFLENMFNSQFNMLHMLFTSRKVRDIEDSFESLGIQEISIESESINPDIRTYISERIQKDRKMRVWPASVKQDIEQTLMSMAEGM